MAMLLVALVAVTGPASGGGHVAPIVIIGDSVSVGVGATVGNGWTNVLGRSVAVDVHARNGATTGYFVEHPPRRIPGPRAVIVELGINDWGRHVDPATYAANLWRIVETARAGGDEPVLIIDVYEIPTRNGSWKPYRDALLALGEDFTLIETGPVELTADGLHPNNAGHAAIARAVFAAIK
jgi:lysophospholipase L1-like esterase